jgi:hypothetical protein
MPSKVCLRNGLSTRGAGVAAKAGADEGDGVATGGDEGAAAGGSERGANTGAIPSKVCLRSGLPMSGVAVASGLLTTGVAVADDG